MFRCRHLSTDADITWRVNGSPVGQFPDIATGSINDNGTLVNTLTIPAFPAYNGTEVVCLAFVHGPPTVIESTPAVTLIIIAGWYGSRRGHTLSMLLCVSAASTTVKVIEPITSVVPGKEV